MTLDILHISDRFEATRDPEVFRDRWIAQLAGGEHRSRHLTISSHVERREPDLRVVRRDGGRAESLCDSRFLGELEELWADGAPNLVHVHGLARLPAELWSRLAAKRTPVVHTAYDASLLCPTGALHWGDGTACDGGPGEKCFFHECHGVTPFDARDVLKSRLRLRAVRGLFSRVIAPSAPLAARLLAHGFADVHVVPYPAALRRAARPRATLPAHPTVLYAGDLDDAGGLTVLIEAFAELAATHPNVRLRVCSDGEYRGWYEHLAETRGLADRIAFAGAPVDDAKLQAELDVAAALVVPSLVAEALPRVAIEASRRALPIVATRVGSLAHLLSGDRGLLVRPRDARALALHLGRLLTDTERWKSLSANLWRAPLGQEADEYAGDVLAVYTDALTGPRTAVTQAAGDEDLDILDRLFTRIASLEHSVADLDKRQRTAAEESAWLESVLQRIASGRISRTLLHWRGIDAIDEFPTGDHVARA